MTASPRIALIHATPIAMEPIRNAFEALWPEAETVNILEDSLSPDRARSREVSEELGGRIASLAAYGASTGSAAVLFTCSAFGRAIERAAERSRVPVLKPNEAMFQAAIAQGRKVAMLYTFAPARESMEQEFEEEAQRLGSDARMTSVFVDGAIEAVRAGDVATHNRLVAAATARLSGFDAITLAHFSMARAHRDAQAAASAPVFNSPDQAVAKLRTLLGQEER